MRAVRQEPGNPEIIEAIVEELQRLLNTNMARVLPPGMDQEQLCQEFISEDRAREQLALVAQFTPDGLRGKRVLEIGAACGAQLICAARDHGAVAAGVEPSDDEFAANIHLAKLLFAYHGLPPLICEAAGENLPFAADTFDVVFSLNVLEHVQDPERVLAETVRTLKPGGIAVMVAPNYGSFWEGHYGVLWIPHMPRPLARMYVRLFKRDPKYLNTLNFLTVGWLKKIMRSHANQVDILDWGYGIWARRLRTGEFSEWAGLGILKRVVLALGRFGLAPLVAFMGKPLRWQTPIILVFQKK